MKGFRKLVVVGVLLVTLLVVVDTIDAGKKHSKKKEIDSKSGIGKKGFKINKAEKINNYDKTKSANRYKKSVNSGEESSESVKAESYKYKGKKGAKNSKVVEENVSPKITKTYQKVKKYKVVEDGPAEKFTKSIPKKSSHSQNYKEGAEGTEFKPVQKCPQKISKEKESIDEFVNEELYKLYGIDNMFEEDENTSNSRRKKYKLVEVVLEEGGEEDGEENLEGNETTLEVDSEVDVSGIKRTESEEIIEKIKTTETINLQKSKKCLAESVVKVVDEFNEEEEHNLSNSSPYPSELDVSEQFMYGEDSYSSRHEDEHIPSCKKVPSDPSRQGTKKLTLYVIEEEVNGKIEKRIVEEEDGTTMCEVADLMEKKYGIQPKQ